MSRAQTVRMAFQIGGLALGAALFLMLPFHAAIDFVAGIAVWMILGGIGERYFAGTPARRKSAPTSRTARIRQ